MSRLLFLILFIFLGICVRRLLKSPRGLVMALNKSIIFFFLPLMSLCFIPRLQFNPSILWLSISSLAVFLISVLLFKLLLKVKILDLEPSRVLGLTCGISSTSFVGFPIFEMLYGKEGLSYGLILSLAGTVMVFNTMGIYLVQSYSSTDKSVLRVLWRSMTFVPFIAFAVSLFLNYHQILFTSSQYSILEFIVSPFNAVALFVIGLQLELTSIQSFKKELILGLSYKLILAPILMIVFFWIILEEKSVLTRVCILGSAIGPMNAMAIVASQKNLSPRLAVLMPSIGIPLSIPLLFLINTLLNHL